MGRISRLFTRRTRRLKNLGSLVALVTDLTVNPAFTLVTEEDIRKEREKVAETLASVLKSLNECSAGVALLKTYVEEGQLGKVWSDEARAAAAEARRGAGGGGGKIPYEGLGSVRGSVEAVASDVASEQSGVLDEVTGAKSGSFNVGGKYEGHVTSSGKVDGKEVEVYSHLSGGRDPKGPMKSDWAKATTTVTLARDYRISPNLSYRAGDEIQVEGSGASPKEAVSALRADLKKVPSK